MRRATGCWTSWAACSRPSPRLVRDWLTRWLGSALRRPLRRPALACAPTLNATAGPHKSRECLPLALILRNRLKYALTYKEVTSIVKSRAIKVDGKVRTEKCYPAGFQDVIDIDKTDEHFRLLYDVKGRFVLHAITKEESAYKLCRVKSKRVGDKQVPHLTLHDGKTIRYPDPIIKESDTVQLNLETGKIDSTLHFDVGMMCTITGGRNTGRVGHIASLEKHKGSFTIVHIKDANGAVFSTRSGNVFVIGHANKPLISLPKTKGLKLSSASPFA